MNNKKLSNQKLVVLNPLLRAMLITILLIVFFSYEYKPLFAQIDTFDYKGDTVRVSEEIALTFKAGSYEIKRDQAEEEIIDMKEFYATSSPGDPYLPFRIYDIVVPPNIDWKTIKLNFKTETVEIPGKHKIKPAPPFVTRVDDQEIVDWGEDKEIVDGRNIKIYGKKEFFPVKPVNIISKSQMRKWKFVRIGFTPVQYNPIEGKLLLNKIVQIHLIFKRIGTKIFRTNPILSDTVMDSNARKRFINIKDAQEWYRYVPSTKSLGRIEEVDYVIITTNEIVEGSEKARAEGIGSGLLDFLNHKLELGYAARIITQDEYGILTGSPPNGTAEKIHKWLQDNYGLLGIKWVLLIGNPDPDDPSDPNDSVGDVPMKMCWPGIRYGVRYGGCPTDHYYAVLMDSNWDLDKDGFYGEYPDDDGEGGVDFTRDVYVGRIPVYNEDYHALNRILQKTIDYEKVSTIPNWRQRVLLPMKPSDETTPGCDLGERIKDDCLVPAGLGYYRIYDSKPGCPKPEISPCTEENVVSEWKNGYGLVTWFTHGTEKSANGVFWTGLCHKLDNTKPGFTFQASCNNGWPEKCSNLGYFLLKQGAVSTVSASRETYYIQGTWHPNPIRGRSQDMAYYYSCHLLVEEMTTGEALFETKQSGAWKNNMAYNLYGDPSLALFKVYSPTIPEAPSDLEAHQIPDQIHITWQDNSDSEIGFKLEYKEYPSTYPIEWKEKAILGPNINSFQMNILSLYNIYQFRVAAFNEAGISDYSNVVSLKITGQIPILSIEAPNGSEVWTPGSIQKITWKNYITKQPGFVTIKYSIDGGSTWESPPIAEKRHNVGYCFWKVPDTPAINCIVKVQKAGVADGFYDLSNKPFTIAELTPPEAPSDLVINSIPNEQFHVTWKNNSTDAKGFILEIYDEDLCTSDWEKLSLSPDITSYQFDIPTIEHTYHFRVAAFNEQGVSNYSNEEACVYVASLDYVRIITPNGGEHWIPGSDGEVRWIWNAPKKPIQVTVLLSDDYGSSWIYSINVPNAGFHKIPVPEINSDNCIVKVQGDIFYDLSDSTFSIGTSNSDKK